MSIIRDFAKFIEPTGQLEYDNTNSGLSADTIKSAIDEINVLVGGGNVGSQATFSVYEFVATGGQTVFNLASTFTTGLDVTAGNFVIGTKYTITATNTTDFTAIGAADSNPGTVFEATGAGTGTGTAKLSVTYVPGYIQVYLNGIFLAAEDYNATDGEILTLTEAAELSDLLSIVVLDSLNMALLLKVTNIDSNAPENLLSVDSSGNVGLGTATPVNTLHVDDTAGGTVRVTRLGTSPTAYGRFEHDGTNTSITSSAELIFNTNATPSMRIDASGNVGIGTSTPASTTKLHLSGAGTTYMRVENTITGVTSDFGTTSVGTTIINRSATPMLFFTDSAERLRIDATGNVGIAVSPEAWNTNSTALDIGSLTTVWNDTSQSILSHNVYKNVSGILAYRTTAEASYYEQNAGNHIWYNAVSGTNDADITTMTERARIDTSGNFVLPDNGKAIFGAGSDLQIYHNGSHSIISDTGTGNLKLGGTGLELMNGALSEYYFAAIENAGVYLYYDNAAKLTTSVSGISVTGTVTADGLTVVAADAALAASIGSNGQRVYITPNGTEISYNASGNSAGSHMFQTGNIDRLNIASNGDISFYNTAGNSQALFWDASAESLGIGTTSPAANITIDKGLGAASPTTFTTANSYLQLGVSDYNSSGGVYAIGFGYSGGATHSPAYIGLQQTETGSYTKGDLVFRTRSTSTDVEPPERMRIGSDGQLTSSVAGAVFKTRADGGGLEYTQLLDVATAGCTIFGKTNRGDVASISLYQTATGADGGYIKFSTSNSGSTTPTEKVRITQEGNLLVGTTTTPSLTGLAVGSTTTGKNISVFSSANGTNGVIGIYQSNGTQEGQLYAGTGDVNLFGTSAVKVVAATNGVELTSGATSWTAISDERKKDIIEPITNAAQKVSTLRSVIGKYKTDSEGTRRSFLIAQDVQAVLPEAVDASDENELGLRYTETIPLLVAAIQEQQEQIEQLKADIAVLKGAN